VNWLRAGYPAAPGSDYILLLALLTRRLSDDEVMKVVDELAASGTLPAGSVDIGVGITRLTDELPHPEDVGRVRQRLIEVGWPVTD
jgi:hypothetical protein